MSVYLFVPASRPERFAKACATAATVIIDLEDAVSFDQKDAARAHVRDFDGALKSCAQQGYWLRINGFGEAFEKDITLLAQLTHVRGVVIPKCQSQDIVEAVFVQSNLPIIAAIETVAGWEQSAQIARASGVYALTYGCLDLANALHLNMGGTGAQVIFDRLRSDLVLHSAAAGIERPIESIFAQFDDDDGLRRWASHARGMGFGGQLCIHPRQVPIVREIYADDERSLAFARAVLAHHQATGEFAFSVDGQMVDLPVIEWAKQLLV